MSKHTLGKWIFDSSGEALVVRDNGDGRICTLNWLRGRWGSSRRTDGEVEANGRLIAAAPDMLDTLLAMREAVYEQPIGCWFHAIEVAIAKATGED